MRWYGFKKRLMCFVFFLFIFVTFRYIHVKHTISVIKISKAGNGKKDMSFEEEIGRIPNKDDFFHNAGKAFNDKEYSNVQTPSSCPVNKLYRKHSLKEYNISCRPHKALESGCKYAKNKYRYYPDFYSCDNPTEQKITICTYADKDFFCDYSKCEDGKVVIEIYDPIEADIVKVAITHPQHDLKQVVYRYAKDCIKNQQYYMFLSCARNRLRTQLFLLRDDVILGKTQPEKKLNYKKKIHVNVIFLDSLSRPHFYRSLKKTIQTFQDININLESATEVLDFELFQSIHGHTHANNKALFSGETFSNDDLEIEKHPTGLVDFMLYFKKMGYYTLFQEDLCWRGVYGLTMDIGSILGNWFDFKSKLKRAHLNETGSTRENPQSSDAFKLQVLPKNGITFASCKLLQYFSLMHPYNTMLKLCYNAKQYSLYFLDHVQNLLASRKSKLNDIFSYTSLNTPHDFRGVRVQSIDSYLSDFVLKVSAHDNVLTIIFSDHGNSYSDYNLQEMEGRYEMFHPSMFMVLPIGVKRYLGSELVNALRMNQNRLFTMLDFHDTLFSLANFKHDYSQGAMLGLFQVLPAERKCIDLPLRLPNLCVCDGWQTPVKNDASIIAYLEFAVGKLNNIISDSGLVNCKRIVPTIVNNVYQRSEGDVMIKSFDIHFQPGKDSMNKDEVINVQIQSSLSSKSNNNFTFLSWDRISPFGIYSTCDGSKNTPRFCVCDISNTLNASIQNSYEEMFFHRTSKYYNVFNINIVEEQYVLIKDKLILVERKYGDMNKRIISVSFEVINFSNETKYAISILFNSLQNMEQVTLCETVISHLSVKYVCTLHISGLSAMTNYKFTSNYEET